MPRPKIGLALGSGSARGWCHIGIIEALNEKGIAPDIVCGCSIGAMVGAAYVADRMTPLKDWILALKWREIASSVRVRLASGGLIDGDVFLGEILGSCLTKLILRGTELPEFNGPIAVTRVNTGSLCNPGSLGGWRGLAQRRQRVWCSQVPRRGRISRQAGRGSARA